MCTTKESLLDIKRDKINDLLSTRITISHVPINKSKVSENKVEDMREEIAFLKNQVEYYKGDQDALSKFIEEVLGEDKINEQIRKYFLEKVLKLQGETM
jgi:hypothetical protein